MHIFAGFVSLTFDASMTISFTSKTLMNLLNNSFLYTLTSLNLVPNAQVCVYLMVHITKLQLQTTFPKLLYIPYSTCIHETLATQNLVGFVVDIDIKILGVPPPPAGPGMPFLDSHTCTDGGLFISAMVFFLV